MGVCPYLPPHNTVSPVPLAAASLAFCTLFSYFQDAVDLRKGKVHAEEA